MLGDTLSRAPHASFELSTSISVAMETNGIEVTSLKLSFRVSEGYSKDITLGPIFGALNRSFPSNSVQNEHIKRLIPSLRIQRKLSMYKDKFCVPGHFVKELMHLAHDCPDSGHFSIKKSLSMLDKCLWNNKCKDIKLYCAVCTICQQNEDGRRKLLGTPQPLQFSSHGWRSIAGSLIIHRAKTALGYDAITTFADRFSLSVRFVPSCTTDSATDFADTHFLIICRHHGLPNPILSVRDPKFSSNFGKG